ncbi:hypothetical protein [Paramicrobacterium agarici]|uniref:hypothetical protein n=1 Tax=Paramicrobacterium agarici TaxID=630514 RepID=UPI0011711481|nr:hypothetical protein [Microbacterium agarici]TQO22653.1 hypothetical protein FB385_1487 [Microbacterium agarici]
MDAGSQPKDARLSDSETEFPLENDPETDESHDGLTYVQNRPGQSKDSDQPEDSDTNEE